MTRFFFWNFHVQGRVEAPAAIVARTALRHDADLVILAESKVDPGLILEELNRDSVNFHYSSEPSKRFQVFTRFPGQFLETFRLARRMSIRRLRLPGKMEILVAFIHFYDRRNHTREEQHSLAIQIAAILRDAEADAGHKRTVLVGDFNMLPSEDGMVDAYGFGAMMTKDLARKRSRDTLDGRPRFYNPMWGRMGDMTEGPPGTFYYRKPGLTNVYWHLLDQVLVRPELIDAFVGPSLQVLDRAFGPSGEIELIRETPKHSRLTVSDHLPILFALNLPEEPSDEHHA